LATQSLYQTVADKSQTYLELQNTIPLMQLTIDPRPARPVSASLSLSLSLSLLRADYTEASSTTHTLDPAKSLHDPLKCGNCPRVEANTCTAEPLQQRNERTNEKGVTKAGKQYGTNKDRGKTNKELELGFPWHRMST